MSGLYKKAVVWLGLNEDYSDQDELRSEAREAVAPARREPAPERPPAQAATAARRERASAARVEQAQANARLAAERSSAGREDPLKPSANGTSIEPTVRAIPLDDETSTEPSSGSSMSNAAAPISTSGVSGAGVGTVRAVVAPKTTKPKVVVPKSFNDAQRVGDMFREPKPVIVNMQNAERDLARRLIDFSAGLCYGLGGQMEKVAKDVYLLTPADLEVAKEHRDSF